MNTNASLTANVRLDLSGQTCPAPLLGAKKVVDDLREGEVLALISDCPGTKDDLFAWARRTDNEVVHVEKISEQKNEFFIRKGTHPRIHAHLSLDMRHVSCPGPVIEARKLLEGLQSEQVLKLISSCPASKDEVRTWTQNTGNLLLESREIEPGIWTFFIQKRVAH